MRAHSTLLLCSLLTSATSLCACDTSVPAALPRPPPVQIVVTPERVALVAGSEQQLAAEIRDAKSLPIGGAEIRYEMENGDLASITGSGLLRSAGRLGTAVVLVKSPPLERRVAVTVIPGAPAETVALGELPATAVAGETLVAPLSMRVLDRLGHPVGAAEIDVTVLSGGGSLPTSRVTTDQEGVASTTWTLGPQAGVQLVQAAAVRIPERPAVFTVTAIAGPAARVVEQPIAERIIASNHVSVAVRVVDANGNPRSSERVVWRRLEGDGKVEPEVSTTDERGFAATKLTTGPRAGLNVVTATAQSLPDRETTLKVTTHPGAPAKLVLVAGDKQSARPGVALRVSPSVRVVDAHGNAVPGVIVQFKVVAGNGVIEGMTAVSSRDGLARAGVWRLGEPGLNRVAASAEGMSEIVELTATARR